MSGKLQGKSVTLSEKERKIVGTFANNHSISFSPALRIIIREWDREINNPPPENKNLLKRFFATG